MSRELLQDISYQLEAFIEGGFWPNAHLLLEEINKELAKPEPEPVCFANEADLKKVTEKIGSGGFISQPTHLTNTNVNGNIPLYEHQPAQQNTIYLSNSEVDFIISSPFMNKIARQTYTEFARAIEQTVLKANGLMKGDL